MTQTIGVGLVGVLIGSLGLWAFFRATGRLYPPTEKHQIDRGGAISPGDEATYRAAEHQAQAILEASRRQVLATLVGALIGGIGGIIGTLIVTITTSS